jgi:hypothetical protein
MIKSRRIGWERHVARKGERTGVCGVILAKPEGKGLLGNPMRKLQKMLNSNFKTQGGWGEGEWDLAEPRDRQRAGLRA